LNGKTYHWVHNTEKNDWIEQKPNIHTPNLNLLSHFEELPLKDYDYASHAHPAHTISDLEQLNVLNDLIGRIQDTNTNSLSDLVMNKKQESKIGEMFSWTKYLKIIVISVISFVLFLITVRLLILFNPLPKLLKIFNDFLERRRLQRNRQDAPIELVSPMLTSIMPSSHNPPVVSNVPPVEIAHSHKHCSYVVGKGLVWEDHCPCDPNTM
jgi:hypothetical protein